MESEFIDIIFDGPPSHESGRLIEVENQDGHSIAIDRWIDRGDGTWALRIKNSPGSSESAITRGLRLLKSHFDDDGHEWTADQMKSVRAALAWIDIL